MCEKTIPYSLLYDLEEGWTFFTSAPREKRETEVTVLGRRGKIKTAKDIQLFLENKGYIVKLVPARDTCTGDTLMGDCAVLRKKC